MEEVREEDVEGEMVNSVGGEIVEGAEGAVGQGFGAEAEVYLAGDDGGEL